MQKVENQADAQDLNDKHFKEITLLNGKIVKLEKDFESAKGQNQTIKTKMGTVEYERKQLQEKVQI